MASKKPAAAGPSTKGLRIIARRDHFRRAGHAFSGEAKTIPLDQLTDDQVESLKAEPLLVVQEVEIPAEEPAA